MLIGVPPADRGHFAGEIIGARDVSGDPSAVAHEHLPKGPEPRTAQPHIDMAVERLHAEQDDGFPRPPKGMQAAYGSEGLAEERHRHGFQPKQDSAASRAFPPSGRWPAGPSRRTPRGSGSPRYACVRPDRCPSRWPHPATGRRAVRNANPDQRFGVGAYAAAKLVADGRQRALSLRRKSRSIVPRAEAAKTTPRQVNVRGSRATQAVDFTVRTS